MQQFAPEAIRGGIYFAHRNQDTPADDRPFIVGALARGPVFITPAHRQDFVDRITLRLAARAVRRREIGGVGEFTHSRTRRRRNARPHTDRERIGNARFETVGELALKRKTCPVAGSLITKEVPPPAAWRLMIRSLRSVGVVRGHTLMRRDGGGHWVLVVSPLLYSPPPDWDHAMQDPELLAIEYCRSSRPVVLQQPRPEIIFHLLLL